MAVRDFHIAWAVWVLVGVLLEIWALEFHSGGGDTLTDQIRWILSHPFMWWCGIGLAGWAVGHLFFGWR